MLPPTKFEIMRENRYKAKRIKLLKEKAKRDLDIEIARRNWNNSIPAYLPLPSVPLTFFF